MNAYKTQAVMSEAGRLTLDGLPFEPGAMVEVFVVEENAGNGASYPSTSGVAEETAPLDDFDGVQWLADFTAAINEAHRRAQEQGIAPPPSDFAATWKQEKRERLLRQNSQP